jgi:hypothetical protein
MMPRGKKKILQAGNIFAVVITILINALAVLLPLNGKTTQELSDALPFLSGALFIFSGLSSRCTKLETYLKK